MESRSVESVWDGGAKRGFICPTSMVKKLSAVSDGLGVVIERPILELLGITANTPLEVTTGEAAATAGPHLAAADRCIDAHEETWRVRTSSSASRRRSVRPRAGEAR
jgi:hypothetical protein